jgi:peptidoglycan/LPS O-acetylase OafA/YrhL
MVMPGPPSKEVSANLDLLRAIAVMSIVFYGMVNYPLWAQIAALIVGAAGIPAVLYVSIEKPLILVGGHVARRLLRHSVMIKDRQPA